MQVLKYINNNLNVDSIQADLIIHFRSIGEL